MERWWDSRPSEGGGDYPETSAIFPPQQLLGWQAQKEFSHYQRMVKEVFLPLTQLPLKGGKTVLEILIEKHTPPSAVNPTTILNQFHPIIFDSITPDCNQSTVPYKRASGPLEKIFHIIWPKSFHFYRALASFYKILCSSFGIPMVSWPTLLVD